VRSAEAKRAMRRWPAVIQLGLLLGAFALVLVAGPLRGDSTSAQVCASRKLKATSVKAKGKLKCHVRAAKDHVPPSSGCLSSYDDRFSRSWDKAEFAGGCATVGDKSSIENKVDAFVDDVVSELTGSPEGALLGTADAQRCAAAKLRATARKTYAKLRCQARGAKVGMPADSSCLSKAEAKFAQSWSRAEHRGGCATTADQSTIEGKVDAFVNDVVMELVPTSTTTTTSTLITLPLTTTSVVLPSTTLTLPLTTTTVVLPSTTLTLALTTTTAVLPTTTSSTLIACTGVVFPACSLGGCPGALHCTGNTLLGACVCQ